MGRLPIPGADDGVWGDLLNAYLSVEHNSDGTLKTSGTISEKVNNTVTVSAGTGLTGGGDLSANRTISASFGTASGTVAEGNDSRITGAIQSTTVDAKGDILAASAADTVTRVAVGTNGQILMADSTKTAGVTWGTPQNLGGIYPLSAYGYFSASADPTYFMGSASFGGNAFFARLFVPAGTAINAIGTLVRTAGTLGGGGGGLNGMSIYTDAGVLVTSTVDDNNMWETAGWVTKVLGTPIAAQTTDRFVYCGISCRGYSADPAVPYLVGPAAAIDGGGYGVTHRRSFYLSITSWAGSFNPQTYGSSVGGYLPLITLA
jgi:hypothetical protein